MSTVDLEEKCPKCKGYVNFHVNYRVPGCTCGDGTVQDPRVRTKAPDDEPPPPPCPKCKGPVRTRIWTKEDGVHYFCADCGWMERDPDNVKFKARFCSRCGRVPIPSVYFDMPDEKILDDSMLRWQCCGVTSPVWPNEVRFWCHIYLGMENSDA